MPVQSTLVWGWELFIEITEGKEHNKQKQNRKCMLIVLGFTSGAPYSTYRWKREFSHEVRTQPAACIQWCAGTSPGLQEPILWIFCWLSVQWLNIRPYWEQLPHRNWQMSQITAFLFQESFWVNIYQNTTVVCVCVYRCIYKYMACVY